MTKDPAEAVFKTLRQINSVLNEMILSATNPKNGLDFGIIFTNLKITSSDPSKELRDGLNKSFKTLHDNHPVLLTALNSHGWSKQEVAVLAKIISDDRTIRFLDQIGTSPEKSEVPRDQIVLSYSERPIADLYFEGDTNRVKAMAGRADKADFPGIDAQIERFTSRLSQFELIINSPGQPDAILKQHEAEFASPEKAALARLAVFTHLAVDLSQSAAQDLLVNNNRPIGFVSAEKKYLLSKTSKAPENSNISR